MKKLFSRLLLILMLFSLTIGNLGITTKATEENSGKGQGLEVLGPND